MPSSRHDGGRRSGPSEWLALDLVCLVLIAGVGSWRAIAPTALPAPLHVGIGIAFTFLAPGAAFVALLFPGRPRQQSTPNAAARQTETSTGTVGGWERLLLSVAASVLVTPFAGLFIDFSAFEIARETVLLLLGGLTLSLTAGAWYRRLQLPPQQRYRVPIRAWLAATRDWIRRPDSGREVTLNALLVLAVVLATSSVVFAVTTPKAGETFTEFHVATNGSEPGSTVADGYPTALSVGESASLAVGIGNHEGRRTRYTLVTQAQHVRLSGGGNLTVREAVELDRRTVTIPANTTLRQRIDVRPRQSGEDVRLVVLLYRGDPPTRPAIDTAYRHAHFWIDVAPRDDEPT